MRHPDNTAGFVVYNRISGVVMPVDGGSVAAGAYMVEKYRQRKWRQERDAEGS